MGKTCKHEPDLDTTGLAFRHDEGCDIGVFCAHCGESGFATVWAEDFRWQDDDDWDERGLSKRKIGPLKPPDAA
jgi:hypothetical protein